MSLRAGLLLAIGAVLAGALTLRARPAEQVSSGPIASSSSGPVASGTGSAAATPAKLEGGKASIEELGKAFIAALADGDREALQRLTPTYRDYATLLYPELVKAGEPLLGSMGLQWAWDNLGHASTKDLKRLLEELGGKKLTFVSIVTGAEAPRGRVSIFPNVVVTAADASGKTVEIRGVFAVVARDGVYQVLRYRRNRE